MRTAILKTTSIGNVAAPRVEVTGVLYNLGRGSTEVESHDEKPVSVYFTEPNMILDRIMGQTGSWVTVLSFLGIQKKRSNDGKRIKRVGEREKENDKTRYVDKINRF
ncbi:hypothetical protein V1477_006635, partial [Vespula maculifrons]